MNHFVADTHALFWYLINSSELGSNARIDSYVTLAPNDFIHESFLILANCRLDGRTAYLESRRKLDEDERGARVEHRKGLFDHNLFVNWGDACLDVPGPGSYLLVATVHNDHVIVPSADSTRKTATGSLKSEPLVLTIER
jgi:hypothetical protein